MDPAANSDAPTTFSTATTADKAAADSSSIPTPSQSTLIAPEVVAFLEGALTKQRIALTEEFASLLRQVPTPSDPPATIGLPASEENAPSGLATTGLDDSDYLDTYVWKDHIETGFPVFPSKHGARKPHYFNLYDNDPVYTSLKKDKKTSAAREYQVVVCNSYYLSCAVEALHEALRKYGQDLPQPAFDLFFEATNTLHGVEHQLRDALGYLRFQYSPEGQDALFMGAAHHELFQVDTLDRGSSRLAKMHAAYVTEVGRSALV
jgi:hypothetical protein